MVKISYLLSEVGRKAELLAGRNASELQTAEVCQDDPAYAEAVAMSSVDCKGNATIDFYVDNQRFTNRFTQWDRIPTTQELLDDRKRVVSLIDEEAHIAYEKLVSEWLHKPVEKWLNHRGEMPSRGQSYGPWFPDDERLNEKAAQASELSIQILNAKEQRNIQEQKEKERKQEEAERAKAEGRHRLQDWAIEHGSDLLKKRIEHGFDFVALARTEYCHSVVLGTTYLLSDVDDYEEFEERETPTLDEINAFEAIKKLVGDKGVCTLYRGRLEDEDYNEEWHTECAIDIACPDGIMKTIYLMIN